MKNLIILIIALTLLTTSSAVYATKNETGAQETGNQLQNQVETKNEGEDSQLEVKTQEQEEDEEPEDSNDQIEQDELENESEDKNALDKDESPRSETAEEHMSIVSEKVEELLLSGTAQGGIGEQVKQIAQEQKQAQDQIKEELEKVEGRGRLLRSLIGPNYKSLNNLQKQMEQNQLRIQQLEQLKNQLTNQSEIIMVQEMIQALTDQNTALQNQINLEQQSNGVLGWLFKLLTE